MGFVNEYIPEDDIKKYGIDESIANSWTAHIRKNGPSTERGTSIYD